MIEEGIFKKVSIFVILGALIVLFLYMIWPVWGAIVTGLLLAYIFYPVYKKIFKFIKEKNVSSIIVILLVIVVIILPLWFLLPLIVQQVFDLYLFSQKIDISSLLKAVFPSFSLMSADITYSLNSFIISFSSNIMSHLSGFLFNLPNIALKLVVIIFVFFFGLRDGEVFLNYVKSLSPFSKTAEAEIAKKFKDITNAVIYGHFIIGLLQGLLTGLGLLITGVPHALILTIFAMLTAVIPIIGAWLVWIPASIYLIVSGHVFLGVALAIYGAIFISWIDNVLRSYWVARKVKISSAVVLVGMIGGLIVFGLLGLIIGPLIVVYLLLILDAYRDKKMPGLFS